MKGKNRFWYTLLVVSFFFPGCTCSEPRIKPTPANIESTADSSIALSQSQLLPPIPTWDNVPPNATILYRPKYAQNFLLTIEGRDTVLYTRYSAHNDSQSQEYTSTHRYVVKSAQRVVCLSTSHIAAIDAIHQERHIVGVSGKKYIYSRHVEQAVDVGYEANIDYETLLRLKPDVVFAYYINGQPMDYLSRMEQLGLNVVLLHDHTEPHPLGRTEYINAFAAFFCGQYYSDNETFNMAHATKLFQTIDIEYSSLCSRVQASDVAPVTVLCNAPYKDVWYIPSVESHVNILIRDAGGKLLGAGNGTESRSISIEQAYLYALQADFWINTNNYLSLDELTASDPRFAQVPCVENNAVWNNNLHYTVGGGNDYYESGTVFPHYILADLIAIFHPQIMPAYQFLYYRHLSK